MQRERDDCVATYGASFTYYIINLAHCLCLYLPQMGCLNSCLPALLPFQRFSPSATPKSGEIPGVTSVGPESERCAKLIEAHKQCLRSEGFKVHAISCLMLAKEKKLST